MYKTSGFNAESGACPGLFLNGFGGERLNSSGDTGMMQVKTVSRKSLFFYFLPKALSIKGKI